MGLKAFSNKVAIDGRSYRDIYYYEHSNISFDYSGLTAKEKAVKINKEFTKSMKKELPDKDKKDASGKTLYDGSLRSKKNRINDIAEKFGGGGHACAAGVKNLTQENMTNILNLLRNRI